MYILGSGNGCQNFNNGVYCVLMVLNRENNLLVLLCNVISYLIIDISINKILKN